ncbi:MAG: metallophosphoesterase family protein [Candidatus Latescibacteria bacterium]|nr:metallophosphoesterase family protein [Candidatus Latescibacterota bacterium]
MRATHTWTQDTATIHIESLQSPMRMLHITDAHVACIDDRDAEHQEACEHYRKQKESNEPLFHTLMAEASSMSLDLVALTGDITHYPAQAAIESISKAISQVDVPVLYTSGNHDWWYPHITGREELRSVWWPTLDPLTNGQPSHASHTIGGIQFLLVDDSTYQVNEEQLAFVQTSLKTELPTVLLTHIPISLPTLRDRTIEKWRDPILIADPNWPVERRDRWRTGADLPSTLEFARTLASAENLVAVFCGHIHFDHTDALTRHAVQYVGSPGFESGKRLVEFLPLSVK